jgi:hypothetical protein
LHFAAFVLALIAAPALAAKKPPPPPPLPPLVLDAAAPVVTVSIDGKLLRLRVDPAGTRHVQLNASAARRLDLANPARLVAGKPVDQGRSRTQVGKVPVTQTTSDEIIRYQSRDLPLTLAWSTRDHVAGADGMIAPRYLPHDAVRWVRRTATASDVTVYFPMQWHSGRGLLGTMAAGPRNVDVEIDSAAAETIVTAAAASHLAAAFGGRLDGPVRDAVIALGVSRPVRDVVFDRPIAVAGVRLTRASVRLFDWSGTTSLPADPLAGDEIVVRGRFDGQRRWAKLVLGNDRLSACADMTWTREPQAMDLTCPGP